MGTSSTEKRDAEEGIKQTNMRQRSLFRCQQAELGGEKDYLLRKRARRTASLKYQESSRE